MHIVEKILNNTTPYGKIRASHEGSLHSSTLSSNIPQSPAYGVFVSQLIRYARASSLYEDFIMRSQLLTSKLLKQGFTRNRLVATFKKLYGRHSVLVDRFKVSVTNIIIDLFLGALYR